MKEEKIPRNRSLREFTYSTIDNEQRPQCLICSGILANDSMKPVKLKRHVATKHAEF
jgi:hypothetical protein